MNKTESLFFNNYQHTINHNLTGYFGCKDIIGINISSSDMPPC